MKTTSQALAKLISINKTYYSAMQRYTALTAKLSPFTLRKKQFKDFNAVFLQLNKDFTELSNNLLGRYKDRISLGEEVIELITNPGYRQQKMREDMK